MRTSTRDTLRAAAGLAALVGMVGLAVGWVPVPADGETGAQEAQVYQGKLSPLGGSGLEGPVKVKRAGEQLSVNVNARGLGPGTHPQHLHEGASCDDFGGVAVPLDSDLGNLSAGDYPSTEGESSSMSYSAKGSNAEFAGLDLANMTVVVHASDGTPVACAELDRKGGGEGEGGGG